MDIRFYFVNEKYIDYLKKYEIEHRGYTCVPNVTYANRNKFVYGAVLNINNINYFVPVSSKIKKDQYSMLIETKEKYNNIKGSLRFKYMIPIPNQCLLKLDIKTMIEPKRQSLVLNELAACRKNRDKIFRIAEKTYSDVTKYFSPGLKKNSCDFKLLEQAYIEYCIANDLEEAKNSEEQLFIEKINDIAEWADEVIKTANERIAEINEQEKLVLK
ncbi:MAG: type III toxin-antitoxin system ToxN/AbiQ family toxin [Oscillospiraceae bacterium]